MSRPRMTLKRLRCIEEALWFYIDTHFRASSGPGYIADDENGGYSDAYDWTRKMIAWMEERKENKR